jgi:hypothetical protein
LLIVPFVLFEGFGHRSDMPIICICLLELCVLIS